MPAPLGDGGRGGRGGRDASDAPARAQVPRISVVMPVRNVGQTVAKQLAALAAQTYRGWWELVVADNGSTDNTLAVVREWSDRLPVIRIVDASVRPGITYARNTGAAIAEGDLIAFCDGDDAVDRGWLEAIGSAAAGADLIGGHVDIEDLNDTDVRQWRSSPTSGGLPAPMGLWTHVVGANFAVWRNVYWDVGGCDEAFTAGGDDVDLSWRIQLAGGTIAFAPDAVVHYRLRPDLRSTHRQVMAYGISAALLYRKFRRYGCERPSLPGTARYWIKLLRRAPQQLARPAQRGGWVVDASYQWGRVWGALRHRVLFW